MNKSKHRLLTPTELAEQRKELAQKATAKMLAAQKKRAEAAAVKAAELPGSEQA